MPAKAASPLIRLLTDLARDKVLQVTEVADDRDADAQAQVFAAFMVSFQIALEIAHLDPTLGRQLMRAIHEDLLEHDAEVGEEFFGGARAFIHYARELPS